MNPAERPVLRQAVYLAILCACASLCLLRIHLGLRGVNLFTHDFFVPLDGAWRMLWGQRPHIDFYTPFGIGTYLPTLIGLKFSSATAAGFGIGQGVTGLLLALWAFALGRTRFAALWILASFCVLVTLTAIGISSLGLPTFIFTPAMTYNRHCYALVMLILVEALVPPIGKEAASWQGGASTGAALALLLFTKITFFFGAAALVVLLLPCASQTRARLQAMGAAFAAVSLSFTIYFGFNLMPMFHDLGIAAKAKRIPWHLYRFDAIFREAGSCALLGLGSWLLTGKRNLAIAAFLLASFGIAFIVTSYEPDGFPLTAVLALVILNGIRIRKSIPAATLALCCCVPLAVDIGAYSAGLLSASRGRTQRAECSSFSEDRMNGVLGCGYESEIVKDTEDGAGLIRKHRLATDTVLSLDFANPFPFMLSMPPMRGGTNNQQYRTTFNNSSFPVPERLFGTATLVVKPKRYSDESLTGTVEEVYGKFLRERFTEIGESEAWVIYRRKAAPANMNVPLKSASRPLQRAEPTWSSFPHLKWTLRTHIPEIEFPLARL